jgi:hypothetical protein
LKQFNGIIQTDEQLFLFTFSRVYTTEGEKYFVTVNRNGGFYPFDMKMNSSGKWKVPESARTWLKSIEEELSNIVIQNTI